MTSSAQPHPTEVFFGDYNGHMRPLSRMYFSSDSRCLVADHPQSVQEEVESHFCPHCNSLWAWQEAQGIGNRCLQCFECPDCDCVLTPSPTSLESLALAFSPSPSPSLKNLPPLSPAGKYASSTASTALEFCLRCLYCHWSSEDELAVVAPDLASLAEAMSAGEKKRADGGAGVVGLVAAAKQREMLALREAGATVGVVSKGGRGGGRGAAVVAAAERPRLATSSSLSLFGVASLKDEMGPWKVTDLEQAVCFRNKSVSEASQSVAPLLPTPATATATAAAAAAAPLGSQQPRSREEDTDGPDPALWSLSNGRDTVGLKERVEASWRGDPQIPPTARLRAVARAMVAGAARVQGESKDVQGGGYGAVAAAGGGSRWPRRVRLRPRLGKRCRKDLAAGRAGILIKAKFNPLEGDSSGAKKSEWFKKDCSAALLVPRLTVASLPSISALTGSALAIGLNDDDPHTPSHKHSSLILRMSNPQSTPVRVRLAHDPALLSAVAAAAPLPSNEISDPTIDGAADGPGYVIHHEECIPSGVIVAAGYGESMYMGSSSVGLGDYTGMCDMGRHKASPRSSGPGEVQEEGAADTAATAAVVGPTNVTTISVTVSPKSPTLVGDGGWAMLDGKEDELFLRASSAVIGSRYRLPESAIRLAAETPTSTGAGAAPAAKQRSTGENVDGAGDDESGRDSAGATQGTPPFVLHQQGDVVWVQLPFDEVAAEGVAAAAGAASKDGVNDDSEDPGSGGEVGAVISVTVRFLLVMSDWEDAGRGGEVRMPVAVRFPLSACPR